MALTIMGMPTMKRKTPSVYLRSILNFFMELPTNSGEDPKNTVDFTILCPTVHYYGKSK